jgi:hypothetical protein
MREQCAHRGLLDGSERAAEAKLESRARHALVDDVERNAVDS